MPKHPGKQVIDYLRQHANQNQIARVCARGIPENRVIGTPKEFFKLAVREFGVDTPLAMDLWQQELHEARLTAIYMVDPATMTKKQALACIGDIWSWDLSDHFARFLLPYLADCETIIERCVMSPEIYVKRTGFAGIACAILHRQGLSRSRIETWIAMLEEGARDDRRHVRQAVDWALRETGKIDENWQAAAIECALRLQAGDKAQQWVARTSLRELKSLVRVPERKRLVPGTSATAKKAQALVRERKVRKPG